MSNSKTRSRTRAVRKNLTEVIIETPQVATPTIAATSNPFTTNATVTMACATSGATIRYTVNGSIPTLSNGFDYSVGLVITDTTNYRAIAFKTGMLPSNEAQLTVTKSGS